MKGGKWRRREEERAEKGKWKLDLWFEDFMIWMDVGMWMGMWLVVMWDGFDGIARRHTAQSTRHSADTVDCGLRRIQRCHGGDNTRPELAMEKELAREAEILKRLTARAKMEMMEERIKVEEAEEEARRAEKEAQRAGEEARHALSVAEAAESAQGKAEADIQTTLREMEIAHAQSLYLAQLKHDELQAEIDRLRRRRRPDPKHHHHP